MTQQEFFDKMHKMELEQGAMCKEIHKELKRICGNTHMIVFKKPINVDFGDYGSFDAVAMCGGILMARCKCGWCDKPIQPYYANIWRYGWMLTYIERMEYYLDDNPIKDDKIAVCV